MVDQNEAVKQKRGRRSKIHAVGEPTQKNREKGWEAQESSSGTSLERATLHQTQRTKDSKKEISRKKKKKKELIDYLLDLTYTNKIMAQSLTALLEMGKLGRGV